MNGKKLEKIKNISCLCFKTWLKLSKRNSSFNNSERRRMALYCSKNLPTLLRGIKSKHHGDFHCLNCHQSFAAENKHEKSLIKKYVKIKIFVTMKFILKTLRYQSIPKI